MKLFDRINIFDRNTSTLCFINLFRYFHHGKLVKNVYESTDHNINTVWCPKSRRRDV